MNMNTLFQATMSRAVLVTAAALSIAIGAHADTIHVPDDFKTIQEAINAAENGDEIIVAPGTYFENVNLLGKAITLRSAEGPEKTIIDGQNNGPAITCDSGEGPDTIIMGFTMRNTGSFWEPPNWSMSNIDSSPKIINCHFTTEDPAAVGCLGMYNIGGSPTIDDCLFTMLGKEDFEGCGGVLNENANVTISNSTFTNNGNFEGGAGISSTNSIVIVTGSTFSGNGGHVGPGAIRHAGGTLEVTDSSFMNNFDHFGGTAGAIWGSTGTTTIVIEDSTFESNNSVTDGAGAVRGAVVISGSTFINNSVGEGEAGAVRIDDGLIENCTFISNQSVFGGGAVYATGSPTILNSTFLNNSGDAWDQERIAAAIFAADTDGPEIGGSTFCGSILSHIAGPWTDLQGNLFSPYCPVGDLNGDGAVNVLDLLVLLENWGECGDPNDCPADLNGDGIVNVLDLLILLEHWG